MKRAFVGATIYPVEGNVIENGTLVIEGEVIVEVGRDIDTTGMLEIDCKGYHITPGFIDPHTHTGIWEEGAGPGIGNNDGNELGDIITPQVRVIDAIHPEDIGFKDAVRGGVTTLGVTHGSANAIGGQLCVVKSFGYDVDSMVIKEPAGIKMALGENPKRVGSRNNRSPTTRMGVAYLIRQAFYKAIDYKNKWSAYRQKYMRESAKPEEEREILVPPEHDIGMEILVRVLEGEIPVRCHAHRADDIRTAIRLADEFGYNVIIDHTTEGLKISDVLIERQIPVVVGPLFIGRSKRELIDISISTPGVLHHRGALVSLTTDSPFNPIHGLRDNLIWAIRGGLAEEDALRLVTINPAKILGVDDRVGSLRPGKDADFVIFNGDPLDGRNKVIATYINGSLVYSDTLGEIQ